MKHRLAIVLPTYLLLYAFSFYAAFLARFEFAMLPVVHELCWNALPFLLIVKLGLASAAREWNRTFRHATLRDIVYSAAVGTTASVLLFVLLTSGWLGFAVPRSVMIIDWAFAFLAIAAARCGLRLLEEARLAFHPVPEAKRTLVYGADRAALDIVQTLRVRSTEYEVVGFVDSGSAPRTSLLDGLPVLAESLGWETIAKRTRAGHVLVPSSVSGSSLRDICGGCANAHLKTHVIPTIDELVAGRYKLSVRDVTISDLLRREPAQLDLGSIETFVTDQVVMVTGAAGSIGSELCRQILAFGPRKLVLVDQSEFGMFTIQQELLPTVSSSVETHYVLADVTDRECLTRALQLHEPQVVFHAAAYKHVPLMQENPQEAIRNNVLGTKNVVDLCDQCAVDCLVLVSTDKAVRPSSVMGATKLVGEKYLQATSATSRCRMVTVRFGNVLDSAGSVVPTFRKQIQSGGPITVTHPEMTRFFMTIPEAVQLVLQAGAIGRTGDILILEMGDPVRILDLATDMISLSGLRHPEDIEIQFTGMRPGEKLYEELFYESELGARRIRDKMFCAKAEHPSLTEMQSHIDHLRWAVSESKSTALSALWSVVGQVTEEDAAANGNLRSAA